VNAPVVYLLSLVSGYLLGAISFAVLIARARGVDIFKVGSGNPGATNVLRTLGRPYGYGCFLLDALKGTAAALAGFGLAARAGLASPDLAAIAGLLGAILGHSFSCFLRFRGGKGVATTIGGLLAIMPQVMLIGLLAWLVVFQLSRYVSLASIVLGISLPISALIVDAGNVTRFWFALLIGVLIIVRHHSNIRRLLSGTENKIGKTRK